MLNKELISASIPTLTLNDSIFQALELMSEFHITQLAVVEGEKYLGLVFEEDLMNVDNTALLQSINTHFSKVAVRANTHFIESIQTANDYNLTIVPVIENENEFQFQIQFGGTGFRVPAGQRLWRAR